MISSWGLKQWLWRALPAFLLAFFLFVVAALHNSCSSCNSDMVWFYLSAPSSSSLIAPEFSSLQKPSSTPELDNHRNSSDYEIEAQLGQLFNTSSTQYLEPSDSEEKLDSTTHVPRNAGTLPLPSVRHEENRKKFKAQRLEQDLFVAKQAIMNAVADVETADLHAPIYHNLSMFINVANMVKKLYVPDSHNMYPLTNFVTSYVGSIASKYPFWNLSHGADHFFVSCHDWGPATARGHQELRVNGIKVVCNADVTQEFVMEKDVSLPETFLRAVKPPTKLGGPPPRKRPYLAFFAGQMHGRVRPILLQHWKDKDPDMKIYETLPSAIAKKVSYIRHMRMSKFCICPMGYEVNSPRIVEAVYYDCIPVIIADDFVLPFSEVLNWQSFSVHVKEKEVPELKQILLSIPATEYNSMQARLKHVRQHFMWHYKLPIKYDVFHMILHSLWLRRLASLSVNFS